MRILLLGDSHLANLQRKHLTSLEEDLGATIENRAFGGAWSGDLRKQIGNRDLRSFEVVLLSIGTNDTHPAYASSVDTLRGNMADVLLGSPRTVLLLSPGVHQAPAPLDTHDLNAAIDTRVDIAVRTATEHGGRLVPTKWILDALGPQAWSPDGLHLSDEAYELLIPSLLSALRPPARPAGALPI